MSKKSNIRHRVWIVVGFTAANILVLILLEDKLTSEDLPIGPSTIWFALILLFASIAIRQKCEFCGLPWYEKEFPIQVDKSLKNAFWQRDFYPNPFEIEETCPNCGVKRK